MVPELDGQETLFSAMDLRKYSKSGIDWASAKEHVIFDRLVRYMYRHKRAIRAENIMMAVHYLRLCAKQLAGESEFNQYYFKWMTSCSESFEKHCRAVLTDEPKETTV